MQCPSFLHCQIVGIARFLSAIDDSDQSFSTWDREQLVGYTKWQILLMFFQIGGTRMQKD
jgi:hypothetical protein